MVKRVAMAVASLALGALTAFAHTGSDSCQRCGLAAQSTQAYPHGFRVGGVAPGGPDNPDRLIQSFLDRPFVLEPALKHAPANPLDLAPLGGTARNPVQSQHSVVALISLLCDYRCPTKVAFDVTLGVVLSIYRDVAPGRRISEFSIESLEGSDLMVYSERVVLLRSCSVRIRSASDQVGPMAVRLGLRFSVCGHSADCSFTLPASAGLGAPTSECLPDDHHLIPASAFTQPCGSVAAIFIDPARSFLYHGQVAENFTKDVDGGHV